MSEMITRIKAYREKLAMSQKQLAEKVGVRRETIVRLKNGQYNPSLKLAMDISKQFGATVEDVFIFIDDEPVLAERIKKVTFEVNEELIKLFGAKVERIILYGSYARGDFNLESDVDIMILLNCDSKEIAEKRREISRIASRVGLRNDIMVSLLARNYNEYENNLNSRPFYQNIEREGLRIYG